MLVRSLPALGPVGGRQQAEAGQEGLFTTVLFNSVFLGNATSNIRQYTRDLSGWTRRK